MVALGSTRYDSRELRFKPDKRFGTEFWICGVRILTLLGKKVPIVGRRKKTSLTCVTGQSPDACSTVTVSH